MLGTGGVGSVHGRCLLLDATGPPKEDRRGLGRGRADVRHDVCLLPGPIAANELRCALGGGGIVAGVIGVLGSASSMSNFSGSSLVLVRVCQR